MQLSCLYKIDGLMQWCSIAILPIFCCLMTSYDVGLKWVTRDVLDCFRHQPALFRKFSSFGET